MNASMSLALSVLTPSSGCAWFAVSNQLIPFAGFRVENVAIVPVSGGRRFACIAAFVLTPRFCDVCAHFRAGLPVCGHMGALC